MERLPYLNAWDSFYVIVGSSAAALTGLQFVVMTLISADNKTEAGRPEVRAFGTPTVVHFCVVLVVAAISTSPWHNLFAAALAFGACGVFGVVYAGIVIRRTRSQMHYKPVLEDWIWHT